MHEEFEQLLEAQWAGELNDSGRRRLEALCAQHGELRERMERERAMDRLFAARGVEHAPEGLAGRVMERLRATPAEAEPLATLQATAQPARAGQRPSEARRAPWREIFALPVLRWGVGMAAMVAVVVEGAVPVHQAGPPGSVNRKPAAQFEIAKALPSDAPAAKPAMERKLTEVHLAPVGGVSTPEARGTQGKRSLLLGADFAAATPAARDEDAVKNHAVADARAAEAIDGAAINSFGEPPAGRGRVGGGRGGRGGGGGGRAPISGNERFQIDGSANLGNISSEALPLAQDRFNAVGARATAGLMTTPTPSPTPMPTPMPTPPATIVDPVASASSDKSGLRATPTSDFKTAASGPQSAASAGRLHTLDQQQTLSREIEIDLAGAVGRQTHQAGYGMIVEGGPGNLSEITPREQVGGAGNTSAKATNELSQELFTTATGAAGRPEPAGGYVSNSTVMQPTPPQGELAARTAGGDLLSSASRSGKRESSTFSVGAGGIGDKQSMRLPTLTPATPPAMPAAATTQAPVVAGQIASNVNKFDSIRDVATTAPLTLSDVMKAVQDCGGRVASQGGDAGRANAWILQCEFTPTAYGAFEAWLAREGWAVPGAAPRQAAAQQIAATSPALPGRRALNDSRTSAAQTGEAIAPPIQVKLTVLNPFEKK